MLTYNFGKILFLKKKKKKKKYIYIYILLNLIINIDLYNKYVINRNEFNK